NMGKVREVIDSYTAQGITSSYVDGMRRTLAYLEQRGYADPLSFELHTPMVVDKQLMLQTLALGPYQRRTVYGALAGLRGRKSKDVKVSSNKSKIPDGRFLSTMDETFQRTLPTLRAAFPDRSVFEG